MIKNSLLVLILVVPFLSVSGQTPRYWRLKNKRWPVNVNFYWDAHWEEDYKVPAGVSKETIYHQKINSRDSSLEQETWFNKQGLPIIEIVYAAPTNEGMLYIDSFFYNSNNKLVKKIRRDQDSMHRRSTTFIGYDRFQREASRKVNYVYPDYTETVYDSNRVTKSKLFSDNTVSYTEIYYYTNGREDSMQFFNWGKEWMNTRISLYDTVQLKKEIYIRYEKVRKHNQRESHQYLKIREEYNADGTIKVNLIRYVYNLNDTKRLDVESHISYNNDKTIKECLYFVKEKKAFLKKHYYEYY
jgi:hypothetical protein